MYGVLQPLLISPASVIISGHRRWAAAAAAGLDEVPVIVDERLRDPIAADRAWYEANRNRELTVEQRARLYQALLEIESAEAAHRRSQGGAAPKRGRAQIIAARQAGMSAPTARAAVDVVRAIDAARAQGDAETAERLRATLNERSVRAARALVAEMAEVRHASAVIVGDGDPTPERLLPARGMAARLSALARRATDIANQARLLAREPGGEAIDVAEIETAAARLRDSIRGAQFWKTCPHCAGAGCGECRGLGYYPLRRRATLSERDLAILGDADGP